MLLYFNKNGQLLENLEYGSSARAGTTNFKIIAYFDLDYLDGVDISTAFPNATLSLLKPDLENDFYPTMLMKMNDNFVFDSSIEQSSHFVNGRTYRVYEFDFNDFFDGQDTVVLLDTSGQWKATITLIGSNNVFNVQGQTTFYVQSGVSSEDETEVSIYTILNQIYQSLGEKVNVNASTYLRVVNGLPNSYNPPFYVDGSVVFDIQTKKFYLLELIENILTPSEIEFDFNSLKVDKLFVDAAYEGDLETPSKKLITKEEADSSYVNVPTSSVTDNAIARFDGTTGDLQNSGVIIDDSNNVSGINSIVGNLPVDGNVSATDVEANGVLKKGVVSVAVDKIVTTDTAQDISGSKKFTTLPWTEQTPNDPKQMINKQYADREHDTLVGLINAEKTRAEGVEGGLRSDITDIQALIPEQATSNNQLADKNFVNSTVATQTSNFLGNLDIESDLHLEYGDSIEDIEAALDNYNFEVTVTNNDYCYVTNKDSNNNTLVQRFKYSEADGWLFEYALNNSSFNADEWAAIDSGITRTSVAQINNNKNNIANAYDSTHVYELGDEALFDGLLKRFDGTNWSASPITITDTKLDRVVAENTYQAKILSAYLNPIAVNSWITPADYNENTVYHYGDMVTYDNGVYYCKDVDATVTGPFNLDYWFFIGGGIKVYVSENIATNVGFVAMDDIATISGTTGNDDRIIGNSGIFLINILSDDTGTLETRAILGTNFVPEEAVSINVIVTKQHSSQGSVVSAITYNDIDYNSFKITDNKLGVDYDKIYATLDVVEHFKVNGVEQTITDKTVDIIVPTKTSDITLDNVYSKTQVDTLLADKADKSDTYTKTETDAKYVAKTTAGTYSKVYVKSVSGVDTTMYADERVIEGAIVQRGASGQVFVPTTPTNNSHAASKEYVDAAIAGIHLYEHNIIMTASDDLYAAKIATTVITTSSSPIDTLAKLKNIVGTNRHPCSGSLIKQNISTYSSKWYGSTDTFSISNDGTLLFVRAANTIGWDYDIGQIYVSSGYTSATFGSVSFETNSRQIM